MSRALSRFTKPQTAQQAVLAEIRAMIIRGELPPGTQIVQELLAEQFGVSRVPVREALKTLEGEGHLTYAAHRGYTVTKLKVSELLEVYRLRRVLESDVAGEAVPRIEDEHLTRMRRAMDAMDAAADTKDMSAFVVENREFHFTLFEPSRMHRAIRIIRQLWDTTDPYRSLYFVKPLNRESVNSEHAEILEACRQRDAALVVRLLDVHRGHAIEDLRLVDDWG
ncbi:GntR family transcriptional regulator [Pseudonocardia acaciae]|uniref:GntR family transcriptional regulator n=1 Tax=Pseudonocardia acaciae TaxID=551276 RepID=UPI0007E8CC40|nr:GntR family transcriptional regulator [Pseudonocardia acaciae]